ncbi:hypothetical protein [Sulfitobacter sp. SK011]|uniref:hypothetical protein n=1 Tax=Sulfitobacter sp. SK011 TaxID=1389004 RepID=UPI0013B413C9|nr:hypothetical protein [Sulfitobacter sp. SK011]
MDGVPDYHGPDLYLWFSSQPEQRVLRQFYPVSVAVSVLVLLLIRLDQNTFVQEILDRPLNGSLAKLGMALGRALGAPDARPVIARLVGQKHDDLRAWSILLRRASLLEGVKRRKPHGIFYRF